MSGLTDSVNQLRSNSRQWAAFTTEGHCVVLAPPGSGKTKLLTTRLAHDLHHRIPEPHGAACITRTNAAADELRRRLEGLGTQDRSTLFIGTVHGFALRQIISPFARITGFSGIADASIASDQQLKTAYDQAIQAVFTTPYEDTRNVRSTIEFNRSRMADDEAWALSGDRIIEVWRRYTEILRSQNLIDFDDVIATAVEIVEEHSAIRRVLAARHPHLYVDEYQDLAPGLDRLVRALCFDQVANAELFAVGDPEQAVYGWTGTKPELLLELAERSTVTAVHLEHNYRCGAEIIRVANLLQANGRRVTGHRPGGHVSATHHPGGFADQCRAAVLAVQAARLRGVPLHEIVVICPENAQCRTAADRLRTNGIPAFVRGSEYRLSAATMFVEACAAWAVLGREVSSHRLGNLLHRWRQLLGPRRLREDDVKLTELLLSYVARQEQPAHELLTVLLDLGLRRGLSRATQTEEAAAVEDMRRELTSGRLASLTVRDLAERARKVDRVEVINMILSKGLEFDVVLILGIDEKRVPDFRSFDDPAKLAEDRRKFYVSITRARDEVRIFYSGFVEWSKGTRSHSGPSRFLRDIGLVQ